MVELTDAELKAFCGDDDTAATGDGEDAPDMQALAMECMLPFIPQLMESGVSVNDMMSCDVDAVVAFAQELVCDDAGGADSEAASDGSDPSGGLDEDEDIGDSTKGVNETLPEPSKAAEVVDEDDAEKEND